MCSISARFTPLHTPFPTPIVSFPHLSLPLALLFIPICPSPLLHYPAHVAALVVCPTEVLQVSLRDFVFHFVFNQDLPEEADDSWEAQEKIAQALLARRKMLGGFLKLVMYRNIDLVHAAPIFAQYMRVCEGTHTPSAVYGTPIHLPISTGTHTHTRMHTHTHLVHKYIVQLDSCNKDTLQSKECVLIIGE